MMSKIVPQAKLQHPISISSASIACLHCMNIINKTFYLGITEGEESFETPKVPTLKAIPIMPHIRSQCLHPLPQLPNQWIFQVCKDGDVVQAQHARQAWPRLGHPFYFWFIDLILISTEPKRVGFLECRDELDVRGGKVQWLRGWGWVLQCTCMCHGSTACI